MIRLSVPVRQALARLTLPVLMAAAFALMLLGKVDVRLAEQARTTAADLLAPIYAALDAPISAIRTVFDNVRHVTTLSHDNAVLREENQRLRRWQAVALALDDENAMLKAQLHWLPDPPAPYVTARVVADAGGIYARSVLLSTGPHAPGGGGFVRKGEIALDDRGLVGRVNEVGNRSARILLITDINSRVPVSLDKSQARAILVGTNGTRPRLLYYPDNAQPMEGERVVTSAEANAFPANLPVGIVHYNANHVPEVQPFADLSRLEAVRIFDYGLHGILPPDAKVTRVEPRQKSSARVH
ncbi:rod shape-determining protein MreC [Granulibacter bethesdensis]|uniref:rod shape-determining protein MreC n=1 Tax=Granulibacter bethesdensis TaxID=364410 RepID=UPI00090CD1ED|nr:rod shape-determining protein MreC [Granulibacter bethesdensis]APH59815.1 Rod shape-determining protein mreC [Granulibacter bethesdensis]